MNNYDWLLKAPEGPLLHYISPRLHPFWVPCASVAVYIVVIFLMREWMKSRKPIKTPYLLAAHNFFLTAISLYMAVGGIYSAIWAYYNFGLFKLYCGVSDDVDGPLLQWGNLFYLSKYYELLDTVFLVIRKRDLTVLHLFHHIIVVFTCWFAVHEHMIMGWITCVNNASVHVFMYWYFAWRALDFEIWWRKVLTKMQMVQFLVDIGTSIPFLYFYLTGTYCRGSIASWLNAVLVGAFLYMLFNNFFQHTYKKPAGEKSE